VFAILVKPLCDRLRLLFFGNLHQDWTEFVLSDLGLFRYEQVEFSAPRAASVRARTSSTTCSCTPAANAFMRWNRAASTEVLQEVLREMPRHSFGNDWLDSRREKLLFRIGQQLEKDKDWEAPTPCMRNAASPAPARARCGCSRRTRNSTRPMRCSASPNGAGKRGRAPAPAAHRPAPGAQAGPRQDEAARATPAARLDLNLPVPGGEWRVEGVVLEHLQREDAPVFYVENTLANTLFGLLCWPACSRPSPAPSSTPSTAARRTCTAPTSSSAARANSRPAWRAWTTAATRRHPRHLGRKGRHPVALRGLGLPRPRHLELALRCIPAAHLKLWFQRILQDVKDNRTGFPDLIQFWPGRGRYEMIEVKGPGDRLQDNQLRWIDYCKEHGMPVRCATCSGRRRLDRLHVAVRALCEFTAKQGDLDLRFTPSPTALEGIAGHAVVAARRGEHYRAEVTLEGDYGLLHVRGRADGYDPDQNLIEEVKTYRGQFSSIPDNHRHLHWAQLRIYGHLMCEQLDVQEVNLALVYFDIGTQQETLLRETRTRAELKAIFEDHCGRFIAWAEQEMRHRERRNEALDARCAFRTRTSARASASSPKPCSAPTPASAACWPRRRPASARPSAPCSRLKAAPKPQHRQGVLPGREDAGPQAGAGRRHEVIAGPPRRCACWN
jgi:hypothetical protein